MQFPMIAKRANHTVLNGGRIGLRMERRQRIDAAFAGTNDLNNDRGVVQLPRIGDERRPTRDKTVGREPACLSDRDPIGDLFTTRFMRRDLPPKLAPDGVFARRTSKPFSLMTNRLAAEAF